MSSEAITSSYVIEGIRSRNFLDHALHARAEEILAENRRRWVEEKLLEELPVVPQDPRGASYRAAKKFIIPKPEDDPGALASGMTHETTAPNR